ncbi:hypothetical protein F6X40_27545 [Paraburkholderia sp. UCT31]|uniref:hypothetical protein n=1 Tax=Paraburkholderia sp. UCT31 TaxID=2615209 RepID=UPI0016550723|nr:hypothetical protein [Paraburkholderia sp. UCT31]MBC8740415.1 hypothetical protein [Paraburkholderia sp. UCT31]
MMKKALLAAVALSTLALTGCGGMNSYLAERRETTEMYHIFDARGAASVDTVIKAATDGLTRNTNAVSTDRPLNLHASKTLPKTPGRFDVVDVADAFKGTGMGAMLALSQNNAGMRGLKQAKCDGAVWTAKAVRDITGSNRLDLYVCLYQYAGGYQLDMYADFIKAEGGVMGFTRDIAYGIAGTPEQWVNKTIVDTVRSVEQATHAKVTHVEGQPAIGDLPWTDKYESASK